ncbi:MAG: hypothetical protein ABW046_22175 [Actinoplanes sp.]
MHSVPRLTLTAVAVLFSVTACTGLDEASASSLTQDDLVSELSSQLSTGSTLTYGATYQLVGGETATINRAQRPARTAYDYPGGRLIVTTTSTIRCTANDCTQSDPSPTAAAELPELITPEAVLGMLNTAALDQDATAEQHDTTIAGRHATCLDVNNVDGTRARRFGVCVTNEGALGSFTATIGGTPVDLALTSYSDKPDPAAFDPPQSAKLIDKRSTTR